MEYTKQTRDSVAFRYLSELVRHCDDTRLRSNVRGNFVVSRTRLLSLIHI